jgi:UDP-glucose 4-epimerase
MSLEEVKGNLRDCDAVAHLAAYPGPMEQSPGRVYVNNTVSSFNVIAAAALLGIRHVCLASSINALGCTYCREPRYVYFPLDENHPSFCEDEYSLSKQILELQADAAVRRHPDMTIASLRFHALLPQAPELSSDSALSKDYPGAKGLWAFTLLESAVKACELALAAGYRGHEVFFIVAGETTSSMPSEELARRVYPQVPVRGDLSGRRGFYDCRKAERLLDWRHDE